MKLTAGIPILNFTHEKNTAPVYVQAVRVHIALMASHNFLRLPTNTTWSPTPEAERALLFMRNVWKDLSRAIFLHN